MLTVAEYLLQSAGKSGLWEEFGAVTLAASQFYLAAIAGAGV